MVLSSTRCVTLGKEQPLTTWKQDVYLTNDSKIAESLHQPSPHTRFGVVFCFFFLGGGCLGFNTWRWANNRGEIEAILVVGFVLCSIPTGRP